MNTNACRLLSCLLFTLLLAGWSGCKPARPAASASSPPAATGPGAVEILARADAHDGTVDHVVEDCAVCRLGMKGDASITTTLSGYTLHLCSEGCRGKVQRDPDAVLAMIRGDDTSTQKEP